MKIITLSRPLTVTLSLAFVIAGQSAYASLIGASVSGTLMFGGGSTNYFDSSNGFVPGGYLNSVSPTVVVAEPDIEFGFNDGANLDVANITANQLIITDDSQQGAFFFDMTFTSTAFAGLTMVEVENTFGGGSGATLVGNVITFHSDGATGPGSQRAVYEFSSVPEPASIAILTVGALGLLLRRRSNK
jgi:PEP-CTERM motif